jgi:conjugal transfer pilus assembly protein TraV
MMRTAFAAPRAVALAACALLSACANVSGLGGSAEYGCKAPQGVRCDSVSGNYHNAIQNNLPGQRQRDQAEPSTSGHAPPAAASASPLRSQTRVLRLWFKPWEDVDHDLYDQGFVYVQIDNGQWLIDHVQQRIRDAHAPLRPPRSSALPTPTQPADARLPAGASPDSRPGAPATPANPLPSEIDPAAEDRQ